MLKMQELIKKLEEMDEMFSSTAVALRNADPGMSFTFFTWGDTCRKAVAKIKEEMEKKEKPVEAELEGGGRDWWYVCGECHGMIAKQATYCQHCGRKVKWD